MSAVEHVFDGVGVTFTSDLPWLCLDVLRCVPENRNKIEGKKPSTSFICVIVFHAY